MLHSCHGGEALFAIKQSKIGAIFDCCNPRGGRLLRNTGQVGLCNMLLVDMVSYSIREIQYDGKSIGTDAIPVLIREDHRAKDIFSED
jgi:hypothetical protein